MNKFKFNDTIKNSCGCVGVVTRITDGRELIECKVVFQYPKCKLIPGKEIMFTIADCELYQFQIGNEVKIVHDANDLPTRKHLKEELIRSGSVFKIIEKEHTQKNWFFISSPDHGQYYMQAGKDFTLVNSARFEDKAPKPKRFKVGDIVVYDGTVIGKLSVSTHELKFDWHLTPIHCDFTFKEADFNDDYKNLKLYQYGIGDKVKFIGLNQEWYIQEDKGHNYQACRYKLVRDTGRNSTYCFANLGNLSLIESAGWEKQNKARPNRERRMDALEWFSQSIFIDPIKARDDLVDSLRYGFNCQGQLCKDSKPVRESTKDDDPIKEFVTTSLQDVKKLQDALYPPTPSTTFFDAMVQWYGIDKNCNTQINSIRNFLSGEVKRCQERDKKKETDFEAEHPGLAQYGKDKMSYIASLLDVDPLNVNWLGQNYAELAMKKEQLRTKLMQKFERKVFKIMNKMRDKHGFTLTLESNYATGKTTIQVVENV